MTLFGDISGRLGSFVLVVDRAKQAILAEKSIPDSFFVEVLDRERPGRRMPL